MVPSLKVAKGVVHTVGAVGGEKDVGAATGARVGDFVGPLVGALVGDFVGTLVGALTGAVVGRLDGA